MTQDVYIFFPYGNQEFEIIPDDQWGHRRINIGALTKCSAGPNWWVWEGKFKFWGNIEEDKVPANLRTIALLQGF